MLKRLKGKLHHGFPRSFANNKTRMANFKEAMEETPTDSGSMYKSRNF
jgi:hypothetical protein